MLDNFLVPNPCRFSFAFSSDPLAPHVLNLKIGGRWACGCPSDIVGEMAGESIASPSIPRTPEATTMRSWWRPCFGPSSTGVGGSSEADETELVEVLVLLSRPVRGGTARNDGRRRARNLGEGLEVEAAGTTAAGMEVREASTALRARAEGPAGGAG